MADKPSRGLVLYGDGLARFMSPAQTHLNSLASRALCGFLALSHSPQSENEDMRIVREFAELLDANEAYESTAVKGICEEDTPQEKCAFPSVAERFMGMKAAIVTDNSSVKSFGGMVGFKVFSWNEMSGNDGSSAESSHLASEVLKLLGFQEEKELDSGIFELIFAHIGANTKMNGVEGVDLVNRLVGDFSHKASPGSNIGSRLHMSVIMSYGATLGDKDLELSVSNPGKKGDSELSHLFPHQSYMMKAGKPRVNIRQHCPMLLAQYQHAVTRVDAVESFSFSDFLENGGNLVVPVDRFLHEEALKLALFTETSGENLILDRVFDLFDLKRNGVIDLEEFVCSLNVFHPNASLAEKIKFAFKLYVLEIGFIEREEGRKNQQGRLECLRYAASIAFEEHESALFEGRHDSFPELRFKHRG